MILQRVRPTRATWTALVGLLWDISFGGIREFVWADLRSGLIDLRGLSRMTRLVVLVGFGLVLFMVGVLLYNDVWRNTFDLIPQTNGTPGRGSLIPAGLVPTTMFLISTAWSFCLTGALHTRRLIRLAVLGLTMALMVSWISIPPAFSLALTDTSALVGLILPLGQIVLWLALPIFFVMRWRKAQRPVFEFTVLLVLISIFFALAQANAIDQARLSGIPLGVTTLDFDLILFQALVMPLLLLVGIDVAGFAFQASEWTTEIITRRLPKWASPALLAVAAVARLWTVTTEFAWRLGSGSPAQELSQYVVAVLVPSCLGLAWWLTMRGARTSDALPSSRSIGEAVEKHSLWVILLYVAFQYAALALSVLVGVMTVLVPYGISQGPITGLLAIADTLSAQVVDVWHLLFALCLGVAAWWLARRGNRALGLYLVLFALLELRSWLTDPSRALGMFALSSSAPIDFWWVILLTGIALYWLARRKLTPDRAGRLLLLFILTGLLQQTDFIGNRFSPFFGFAGIGLVAFGILYDAVTAGSWANIETPGLPRTSRIFMYLGYVLITVTVINWALASHDLASINELTGGVALVGFARFGRPMLYAMMASTLVLPPPAPNVENEVE